MPLAETTAQQAYHAWLSGLYGSAEEAFLHGVKTWENLPDKARAAWQLTVDFIGTQVYHSLDTK